ncbi:hypothetical protein MHU86_16918 [Fragilaria crotonensis]|nr:hypothetical protein MHU86_16918 [Fragilaria crotonensis]
MDNNLACNGLVMTPLEIDEEISSLFDETIGRGNLRKRSRASVDDLPDTAGTGFRGLLRTKTAFMVRNACLLATLGFMVFMYVNAMDRTIEEFPMDDEDPRGIHQLGFGGKNNPASVVGQRAHQNQHEDDLHHMNLIPESNVGETVKSLSTENIRNHIGHYWHDPMQSVFASPYYDGFTKDELGEKQTKFLAKMNATKQKYGAWDLVDAYLKDRRANVDFTQCPNKDCNSSNFPATVWQRDEAYTRSLIDEAKKLVQRVCEGIYEEYGHSSFHVDGSRKSDQELEQRDQIFRVLLTNSTGVNDKNVAIDTETNQTLLGIAQLSNEAWDGLVRKLLHSMITSDDFFVVAVGDGSAAGHGNNFIQSPVMQFNFLMEPVLSFLGITLRTRNMAAKGRSVVFGAMAGGDLYGEADLLWYDSRTRSDSKGAKDLLYKQAILSGGRVPVILTDDPVHLRRDSSEAAWIGNLQPNTAICGRNKTGVCDFRAHNSVCWVPRTDVRPSVTQDSSIRPKFFPGNYVHQLEARKLSLLILHALNAALDRWLDGIQGSNFPLDDSLWHIGSHYSNIRESVRLAHNAEQPSECELMMKDLATVCHVEMHGYAEWTPRITPYATSLKAILPGFMSISNFSAETELYSTIDLMPQQWAIPDDVVDPHLIAISTTHPLDAPADGDSDNGGREVSSGTHDRFEGSQGDGGSRVRRFQRRLQDDVKSTLPPGKGWTMRGAPVGLCDGSTQSTCGRDRRSKCLMAGHNDYQGGILGDGLSGWLLLKVPHVKEGIILARIDTQVAPNSDSVTEGWAGENGVAEGEDVEPEGRKLELPEDFWFDYAVNDTITSLSRDDFASFGVDIDGEMTLYPLFISPDMGMKIRSKEDKGETIDVGIRVRAPPGQGRAVTIMLTHVYYA